MKFEEQPEGLLRIEYADAADLEVVCQQPIVARLEEQRGPVVLIFLVGARVRSVPMEVPTFWLGITARPELRITGMAIVTLSAGVRVAAGGFALANVARRVATSVRTFATAAEAEAWARELLAL
jgi:hypothetical protein